MTLEACRQNFIELLADRENKVVALSGKWGTGKTYLWRKVQETSQDEQVKDAVTISLFGLGSLSDLKMKIAQDVLPKLEKGNALVEFTKKNWASIKGVARKIFPRLSFIDEIELIALPMMLKGRFIVIDDIERKHEKLSIDEILGFIDDCVQNLGCRILLILNSDQLKKDKDKDLWETLREKVIDQELRLDTTASEAFDIASGLTPSRYAGHIKPSVEACAVSNIRIIRKILRVTNRLLDGHGEVPGYVLDRVTPSLTLLCAIHYKGMDDGPNLAFVLGFGETGPDPARPNEASLEKTSRDAKAENRWRLLMDKLRIRATDEFEVLVADFLKSGLLDAGAVRRVVERYEGEELQLATQAGVQAFIERCDWNPGVSDQKLLEEAKTLSPYSASLDMFSATIFHGRVAQLEGGLETANEIIGVWANTFRERQSVSASQIEEDYNFYGRPLHPVIADAVREAIARQEVRLTVLDVCRRVREKRSWGRREEACMQATTAEDYERAIRSASGSDLKLLLLQSLEFIRGGATYRDLFGQATKSFITACRSIVQLEPDSRLGMLISRLLQNSNLTSLLDADDSAEAEDGVTMSPEDGSENESRA